MKSLAFYPSANSKGKHDGDYFRGLADLWVKKHGNRAVSVDIGTIARPTPKADRFRQIVAAIEEDQPEVVAFFCHGLRDCLPQMGICSQPRPKLGMPARNVDIIAGAQARASSAPRLVLFACTAGDDLIPGLDGPPGGDGGLADQWRDSMVKHDAPGAQCDAHDRAGDSVHNKWVRRFSGPEDKDHIGGAFLVDHADHVRWLRWEAFLHARGWLDFPFLTAAELAARLDLAP